LRFFSFEDEDEDEMQQAEESSVPPVFEAPEDVKPYPGNYGPYFADYTSAAMFSWFTKHQICK
jgi:hypothetical protein